MAVNQGSRAGLITSVVVLSITSLVAVILAFWFGAEKRKTDQDLVDLKKKFANVISDTALLGADVKELEAVRAESGSGYTPQTKLWDIAIAQRGQLVKIVTGKDAGAENTAGMAIKSAPASLVAANDTVKPANTQLPSTDNNMVGAINVLADKVKVQAQTISQRDAELVKANKLAKDTIDQKDKDLAARDEQIAKIRSEADASIKASTDATSRQQTTVAGIEKAIDDERKKQAEVIAQKDVEIAAKTNEVKRLEDRLRTTQARFDRIRVGVTDPMVRHEDGVISGFSGKDIVYISLGEGKQIIPGMTFEVYDKSRGLPKINDPMSEEQPAGKASIEVIRVSSDTSECRVTRQSLGTQIMQGDPILNVVYDPTIKYNFYVHGDFDLDRNGVATAQDADVVKRIITQWGAAVSPKLGVDTDFVVLGVEPVIPQMTAEEMNDPIMVTKLKKAEAALAAYQQVVKEARELHIPILNQNRFLYFTGQEAVVRR